MTTLFLFVKTIWEDLFIIIYFRGNEQHLWASASVCQTFCSGPFSQLVNVPWGMCRLIWCPPHLTYTVKMVPNGAKVRWPRVHGSMLMSTGTLLKHQQNICRNIPPFVMKLYCSCCQPLAKIFFGVTGQRPEWRNAVLLAGGCLWWPVNGQQCPLHML